MTAGSVSTSKKLVFIGNYGNRNVGDDAILQILSKRYRTMYPDYEQYVFARHHQEDIERISSAHALSISVWSIVWMLWATQMIVIGGGGLFGA